MAKLLNAQEFAEYLKNTEPQYKVRKASDYENEVNLELSLRQQFSGAGLAIKGSREVIRFLPGEVSLWAGINSHGKSRFLSQVVLGLCAQSYKCCITNFESSPKKILSVMARQACMKHYPSPADVSDFMGWSDEKLWVFDKSGRVSKEVLFAAIRYCNDKLGITHFVIDNLQMVVAGEDDYNGQKDFVQELKSAAVDLDMHIHVVHHVRKGETEDKMPGKFDIRGASSIVDMVDNAFIVWRNKAKERAKDAGVNDDSEPDAKVGIVKNRENGHEVCFRLWFDPISSQYLRDQTRTPIHLMQKADW